MGGWVSEVYWVLTGRAGFQPAVVIEGVGYATDETCRRQLKTADRRNR